MRFHSLAFDIASPLLTLSVRERRLDGAGSPNVHGMLIRSGEACHDRLLVLSAATTREATLTLAFFSKRQLAEKAQFLRNEITFLGQAGGPAQAYV